jgi:putative protease
MEGKNLPKEEGKLIGEITHYFGKIGVAIIKLSDSIKSGDTVRIAGGEVDFEQEVGSMEVDHKKVEQAKKGDIIGMKVSEKTRQGYKVYKL